MFVWDIHLEVISALGPIAHATEPQISEKEDRNGRAGCKKDAHLSEQAYLRANLSFTDVICTSWQPSTPITGENVNYSPFHLVRLTESVCITSSRTDLGQSWRISLVLCLTYPRAPLPLEFPDFCHHSFFLATSDRRSVLICSSFETKVRKIFRTVNLEEDN